MKKIVLVIAATLLIVGCSTPELDDGYQFGDITHLALREQAEVNQAIKEYCDQNQASVVRYAALKVIRLYFFRSSLKIESAANEPDR